MKYYKLFLLFTIFLLSLTIQSINAQENTKEPYSHPECINGDEYYCFPKTTMILEPVNPGIEYYIAFVYAMMSGWFILSIIYFKFGKKQKKPITITLVIVGVLWVYAVMFGIIPTGFA